jgi:hypothetical protein
MMCRCSAGNTSPHIGLRTTPDCQQAFAVRKA